LVHGLDEDLIKITAVSNPRLQKNTHEQGHLDIPHLAVALEHRKAMQDGDHIVEVMAPAWCFALPVFNKREWSLDTASLVLSGSGEV
jgi:hypothetical protein